MMEFELTEAQAAQLRIRWRQRRRLDDQPEDAVFVGGPLDGLKLVDRGQYTGLSCFGIVPGPTRSVMYEREMPGVFRFRGVEVTGESRRE